MSDFVLFFLPSILAVVVAAVFTLVFGIMAENKRRDGVRALLTQEVIHNRAALWAFCGVFTEHMQEAKPYDIVMAFRVLGGVQRFEQKRWSMVEIGISLDAGELLRFGEWYYELDALTYALNTLERQLGPETPDKHTAAHVEPSITAARSAQIMNVVNWANKLFANPPAPLNSSFEKDPRVKAYVQDVHDRHSDKDADIG